MILFTIRANCSYIDLTLVLRRSFTYVLVALSSYVDLLPTCYHLVQYIHLAKQRSVVCPQEWESNLGPLLVLL